LKWWWTGVCHWLHENEIGHCAETHSKHDLHGHYGEAGRVRETKLGRHAADQHKLVNRGTQMIMKELNIAEEEAAKLLKEFGSVRSHRQPSVAC